MRKTYEITKTVNRYRLTFIKTPFTGKDWVRFKLKQFRLEEVSGFPQPAEERIRTRGGMLNILSGAIEESEFHIRIRKEDFNFVRKQWLENRRDFLKSKK